MLLELDELSLLEALCAVSNEEHQLHDSPVQTHH